jgi:hypothetical protein
VIAACLRGTALFDPAVTHSPRSNTADRERESTAAYDPTRKWRVHRSSRGYSIVGAILALPLLARDFGLTRNAIVVACGTSSCSIRAASAPTHRRNSSTSLILPPSLLRLETRPSWTESLPDVNTIGMVAVAALVANAMLGSETLKITGTRRRTKSAASAGAHIDEAGRPAGLIETLMLGLASEKSALASRYTYPAATAKCAKRPPDPLATGAYSFALSTKWTFGSGTMTNGAERCRNADFCSTTPGRNNARHLFTSLTLLASDGLRLSW